MKHLIDETLDGTERVKTIEQNLKNFPKDNNIVKKHHRDIDVESEVGTGTTFTVRIPMNRRCNMSIQKHNVVPLSGLINHGN